jgi:effector-binding domain-containing protein
MELLPIGRFARLTGLTVRAVRHYGELGLLQPAYIDPDTGYRFYAPDQVEDAAAIRRLRFLELALDEIREIVDADDPSFTRARLLQHRAKMAELAATTEQILSTLQRLIDGEEKLVPDATDVSEKVLVKEVPETRVLVIRDRQPAETMSTVIPAAFAELESYLGELGVEPAGPPITLCPYADDEGMVSIENSFPVEDGVAGRGRIENAVLPACTVLSLEHWGHYDELDRSYRALQAFAEQAGLEVSGEPREIYWTGPEDLPVEKWLTEIQFLVVRDEAKLAALA